MWMKDIFGTDKPVIGMVHLMAMPTDPKYEKEKGLKNVIERAKTDILALQYGGIDGILFCNEYSIPYTDKVRVVTVATMARIIGELRSIITVPFGVDVAMDPFKVFDLAAATEASFIRETLSGSYAGDYGVTSVQMGEVERHRYDVGCGNIKTLATLIPEGAMQIAPRPIEDVVKSVTFAINPSALLVYGVSAGSEIDSNMVIKAKKVTETPVFASNGVRIDTIANILAVSDGCVVGTWLKYDGMFYNGVDKERVCELMKAAKKFRGSL